MLKALIISSNLKFVQKFFNSVDNDSLGLCIRGIADTTQKVHAILRHKKIDIIFRDDSTDLCFSPTFWKKHSKSTINLSIKHLNSKNIRNIIEKISNIAIDAGLDRKKNIAELILDELKYIGYKIKYKGTLLLAVAILEVFKHPKEGFDNFENRIFPIVANTYNINPSSLKSIINKATNYMYRDCDIDKLKEYFHFYEDTKPSVKVVATEVYNRVKKKLK